jgi:hypothetical protein
VKNFDQGSLFGGGKLFMGLWEKLSAAIKSERKYLQLKKSRKTLIIFYKIFSWIFKTFFFYKI